MQMEGHWQAMVEDRPHDSSFDWINIGATMVQNYNANGDYQIRYVRCVTPGVLEAPGDGVQAVGIDGDENGDAVMEDGIANGNVREEESRVESEDVIMEDRHSSPDHQEDEDVVMEDQEF